MPKQARSAAKYSHREAKAGTGAREQRCVCLLLYLTRPIRKHLVGNAAFDQTGRNREFHRFDVSFQVCPLLSVIFALF